MDVGQWKYWSMGTFTFISWGHTHWQPKTYIGQSTIDILFQCVMNSIILCTYVIFSFISLLLDSVLCNLSSPLYLAIDFPASKWQSSDVEIRDDVKSVFHCANICTKTNCNLWKYSAGQLRCELSDVKLVLILIFGSDRSSISHDLCTSVRS